MKAKDIVVGRRYLLDDDEVVQVKGFFRHKVRGLQLSDGVTYRIDLEHFVREVTIRSMGDGPAPVRSPAVAMVAAPAAADPKPWVVHLGDAVEALRTIPDGSVDAVITDPPYAEAKRDYGQLSEADWHRLMDGVVAQVKRILKPKGSAVFILQGNFGQAGSMRLWVPEFLLRTAKTWNWIQEVYWHNPTMIPCGGTRRDIGLMRPSVKHCLWFGPADCYRNQDAVLLEPAPIAPGRLRRKRSVKSKSGIDRNDGTIAGATIERGGSTPFNMLKFSHVGKDSAYQYGHGAGTPVPLAEWWVRYLTKAGDTVLDPFNGVGSMGVAALKLGRRYIGIEQMPEYVMVSRQRLTEIGGVPALSA